MTIQEINFLGLSDKDLKYLLIEVLKESYRRKISLINEIESLKEELSDSSILNLTKALNML